MTYFSDPFLVIVLLILFVSLVQIWSVQRVEYRHKQLIHEMHIAKTVIDSIIADVVRHEAIHATIATAIRRLDTILMEKGMYPTLLTEDIIIYTEDAPKG